LRRDRQVSPSGWPWKWSRESTSRVSGGRPLFKRARLNLLVLSALLLLLGAMPVRARAQQSSASQDSLPFVVSNPKNQKWPQVEANRIYDSACALVARTVRPERPPRLHPSFLLVLGASDNEVVRNGSAAEIHLKSWDSNKFAEAVVIMAARDVLHADDLASIARQSLASAHATVSLDELKANR